MSVEARLEADKMFGCRSQTRPHDEYPWLMEFMKKINENTTTDLALERWSVETWNFTEAQKAFITMVPKEAPLQYCTQRQLISAMLHDVMNQREVGVSFHTWTRDTFYYGFIPVVAISTEYKDYVLPMLMNHDAAVAAIHIRVACGCQGRLGSQTNGRPNSSGI